VLSVPGLLDEQHYVDLRELPPSGLARRRALRERAAELAAPVLGLPKDTVLG